MPGLVVHVALPSEDSFLAALTSMERRHWDGYKTLFPGSVGDLGQNPHQRPLRPFA